MNDFTGRSGAGSVLLTAAAFVVIVAGMRAAEAIVVPFLLSVFIAIISAPSLFWLERKGLPRWLAMLVVIGVIIAAGIGVTVLVGTSIREFSRDLPEYRARINAEVLPLLDWLRAKGMDIPTGGYMSHFEPGAAVQLVADLLNGFGRVLGNAFLIFLTVMFILFETASFPRKFSAVSVDPEHALDRFTAFRENVKRYLVIKTVASLGTGIAIGLWLAVLGVDYPMLWGLLASLLNYVPNIGSIIAAVPAVLFAAVQLGPGAALWSAAGYPRGERGRRQHHRAAVHGARPRPVGAGGVPVARVLGVGARPGRHVPLRAADDDDQDRPRLAPGHALDRGAARPGGRRGGGAGGAGVGVWHRDRGLMFEKASACIESSDWHGTGTIAEREGRRAGRHPAPRGNQGEPRRIPTEQ